MDAVTLSSEQRCECVQCLQICMISWLCAEHNGAWGHCIWVSGRRQAFSLVCVQCDLKAGLPVVNFCLQIQAEMEACSASLV